MESCFSPFILVTSGGKTCIVSTFICYVTSPVLTEELKLHEEHNSFVFLRGKVQVLTRRLSEPIVCAGMEKKLHFSQLHVPSAIFLSALGWNTLAQIRGSNWESRTQKAKCSTVSLLSSQFGNKDL